MNHWIDKSDKTLTELNYLVEKLIEYVDYRLNEIDTTMVARGIEAKRLERRVEAVEEKINSAVTTDGD